jgi:phosphoglucomutase/phosphopentomutase
MDTELQGKVREWLEFDQNPVTRSEIEKLVADNKYDDLKSRLLNRMEFGTAGLRSKMGAGFTMMNNLTIIQTGQGFLEYLKKFFGQKLNNSGVVIGYDARHNSKTFAYLTANIFLNAGVRVYLFRQIVPTPFVV